MLKRQAYDRGVKLACSVLGLTKEAMPLTRSGLVQTLKGPYGEALMRIPVQAVLRGLGGAAAADLYGAEPWQGALLGVGSGVIGGATLAGTTKARRALIRRLGGVL